MNTDEENIILANDASNEDTDDLQYDLASALANNEDCTIGWNFIMREELIRRGAKLPVNCKEIYSQYHYMKRKLIYDLE
jgi:hypothetical protein